MFKDVDLYKSSVKKEIEEWLHELGYREIVDWLIVVVENYDGKRPNKLLPRTTVLDRIRADFAPKQGNFISLFTNIHYRKKLF